LQVTGLVRESFGIVKGTIPLTESLPSTLYATLHTNSGDIRIQLFPNHAPKTVRNFVELSEGTRRVPTPASGSTTA
jgi:hypothetical protein